MAPGARLPSWHPNCGARSVPASSLRHACQPCQRKTSEPAVRAKRLWHDDLCQGNQHTCAYQSHGLISCIMPVQWRGKGMSLSGTMWNHKTAHPRVPTRNERSCTLSYVGFSRYLYQMPRILNGCSNVITKCVFIIMAQCHRCGVVWARTGSEGGGGETKEHAMPFKFVCRLWKMPVFLSTFVTNLSAQNQRKHCSKRAVSLWGTDRTSIFTVLSVWLTEVPPLEVLSGQCVDKCIHSHKPSRKTCPDLALLLYCTLHREQQRKKLKIGHLNSAPT